MLKKIYNYQLLMLNSAKMEKSNNNKYISILIYFFLISGIFGFIFSAFNFNTFSTAFLIPVISISILVQVLHTDNKLYELVPASNKFTVFNSYILFIAVMLLCYILSIVIGMIFMGGILLLVSIAGGTIEESPTNTIIQSTNFIFNKGTFLMILLLILITFIAITISFIKNKKARNTSFIILTLSAIAPLLLYRSLIKNVKKNIVLEFFNDAARLPQINLILILTSLIIIIAVPLSIKFSYKLYLKRPQIN